MDKKLFYIVVSIFCFQFSIGQTLTLDATFGTNGKVLTPFANWDAGIMSSKLQSDGKIVVCGYRSSLQSSLPADTIIGRYNADGSVDTGFGTNGFIIIPNLFIDGLATKSLLLQQDGKIVVTGSRSINGNYSNLDFYTYRYNTNGTLDAEFGTNGVVITDFNNSQDEPTVVITQSDNRIIVAGTYLSSGNYKLCAVRYNVDGTVDSNFGSNGKVMINSLIANIDDRLNDILIETDDKILFGVKNYISNFSYDYNFALVRLNSNGTFDNAFGTNGVVITDFGGQETLISVEKIANSYYALGYINLSGEYKIAIAKYDAQGVPDSTFGTNGQILVHRSATSLYDLIADSRIVGNKILCTGYGESEIPNTSFNFDGMIIQFNLDGSIDTTFNGTGYLLADFSNNGNDIFITSEIQTDGKIIAEGYSSILNDDNFALARYELSDLATGSFTSTSFKAYPNPFTESITIEGKEELNLSNATIELFDIHGRKLSAFTTENNSNFVIPMDIKLSQGSYFLKITTGNKTETLKIVKR